MDFKVFLTEEAHQDVLIAYEYYEERQTGLGEKFLQSLTRRFIDLANNPTFFSYINEDPSKILRDVRLDKFPYLIVYEIIGKEVIVYALHNTFQNPIKKLKR